MHATASYESRTKRPHRRRARTAHLARLARGSVTPASTLLRKPGSPSWRATMVSLKFP
jgi:hypothetical protein